VYRPKLACALMDRVAESGFLNGVSMKVVSRGALLAAVCAACLLLVTAGVLGARQLGAEQGDAANAQLAKITVDYPVDGSVFPPEITSPTFLWRDESAAKQWVVEVSFADQTNGIRLEIAGELMQLGEIDPETGETPHLTPQQERTRTWHPDDATWAEIKHRSVKSPARVTISGFGSDGKELISAGSVSISTSVDPVGAPVFYRDVPLMLSPHAGQGSIQPLPPFALPLIKWKLRNIAEAKSKTVMDHMPTCGNCHSFSTDGKTFGMDLDGPKNDKGLYALTAVEKNMTIRNQDVIRWSALQDKSAAGNSDPAVKRFGFMSQVSPNGRYVVTSVAPPGLANTHKTELSEFAPGLADRLFSMNYPEVPFAQVFYPTRGILSVYDSQLKKMRALPGANDPQFVQTSAFWSPDGKYLIFSRAKARDPYPPGVPRPTYANDPNETQIKYDLYRIPFNDGRGGVAQPVMGASANGMSNNFPKVTPDGKWIVFVQNKNGLLMRPDSRLYIVPFGGGKARLMKCNTSRMNSWHTFSPNGRWMAFSSKARSADTQLMLTHIDAQGNDTPAIMVENTAAANRAVNIPEFVNIPMDGLERIDPQATEFYRLFNQAFDLMESKRITEAIEVLRTALQREPDDSLTHYMLATALTATDQENEAVKEYKTACTLFPRHAAWFDHLGISQASTGDWEGAVVSWKKALALDPKDAGAESDMGTALFTMGRAEEGYLHLKKAMQIAPNYPEPYNRLGVALAKTGKLDEAVMLLLKAVELRPESMVYRVNLGYVQGLRGDYAGALVSFQKAVALSEGKDWRCLDMMAKAYDKMGRYGEAAQAEQHAVELARQQHDAGLEAQLESELRKYEESASKEGK
jgi:Flp pilus assembly protein TadD